MEQKSYWNAVANDKEFTTPFQFDLFAHYVKNDAEILDIGCGYGRTLEELHHRGYCNTIGIDFSEAMIARGRNLHPHLDLRAQTSKDLGFPDESFAAVILCAVLTCIVTDTDQTALLTRIKRVLKPGGVIYINDFLLNTDERNLERYGKFEKKYGTYGVFELAEGAVLRHHDMRRVEECVRPFETIRLERMVYRTMNGHESNGYCYLGRKQG